MSTLEKAHDSDEPTTKKPSKAMEASRPALPDFRARARQSKLRSAIKFKESGQLSTACATFLEIFAERPLTAEGLEAGEILSEIAADHEASGRHRLAMELYAKLAQA
jgi:hypothetical protein